MLSTTFHDQGCGADDPDLSVALTRSMATLSSPDILYLSVEIRITLRVILIPIFHYGYWWAIVEETFTSGEYISLFPISILKNIYEILTIMWQPA